MKNLPIAILILAVRLSAVALHAEPAKMMKASRLEALVDANIKATQAFESLDAKKLGDEVRLKYWNVGGLSDAALNRLIELQKEMMAQPIESIVAWARGEQSSFDEAKYIRGIVDSKLLVSDPKLPVNVWIKWFREKEPNTSLLRAKSLASLQQMMGDTYRDGDLLQDLFRVYVKLGLPVHFGQIGITATTDADFMTFAKELSPRMGPSPYDESPFMLKMSFRKMYNWGRRYTGERDKFTMARQLMADPRMKAAILKAGMLKPEKVAIIGHSYTMEVNWSTPGTFVAVVTEMMKKANPLIEFKYFQQGGMDAVTAQKRFYDEALAWRPDSVLFVVMNDGQPNRLALKAMVDGFSGAGAKCVMFDCLWPAVWDPQSKKADPLLAGINLIEVQKLLMASPEKEQFMCLDGTHMMEAWHMLMAREWFKYLAGARKEELAPAL